MKVTKCDLCGKEIDSRPIIIFPGSSFSKVDLCEECGEQIIDFLEEKDLLKKEIKQFSDNQNKKV